VCAFQHGSDGQGAVLDINELDQALAGINREVLMKQYDPEAVQSVVLLQDLPELSKQSLVGLAERFDVL